MALPKNVTDWLRGLISAIVSGATNSAAVIVVDPKDFNLQGGLKNLGMAFAAGAIIGGINYLQRRPIPEA